ncbi:MAG: hypothetical protein U1F77_18495 [Kiritimatiellia bacterium]
MIWDKVTFFNPGRVEKETGLVLPLDARIVATEADTLTLCDGPNYGWLIETKTNMTTWIEANMHREDGWKHVKSFGEVAPLARGPSSRLPLDSVWESYITLPDGRTEEAFLYVAEGRTNAMVKTFRP